MACMQPIALTGVTFAAAYSLSSIIISAAVLALGEGLLALGLGGTGRLALFGAFQLVALTGVTLSPPPAASVRSSSRLLLSPSAWAAQATSRCSARVQLIALTGVTFAAACSFSSLIISAAALALGLGSTGRLELLCACAAHRPDRRGARRACSLSSLIISAAVLALGVGGTGRLALLGARATHRVQLIALTDVRLAAACSFSSFIISAAVLALG